MALMIILLYINGPPIRKNTHSSLRKHSLFMLGFDVRFENKVYLMDVLDSKFLEPRSLLQTHPECI